MEPWNQRPVIQVYPRGGNTYDEAKAVENYLQWNLDAMPAYLPIYSSTKEEMIYGTGWGKVLWDWNVDHNVIESITPWNLYPDPAAESVDDAEYIIHRSLRSPAYLKRAARMGFYDVEEDLIDKLAKEGFGWVEEADNLLAEVGLGGMDDPGKNRVEVLELWREDPNYVLTIFNRRLVARLSPNRYPHKKKPFFRLVDHPVPHELFGVGELEITEKLIDAINDAESQKFDVASLAINNVLAYNRQAGIDPEELIMRPGAMVGVDGRPQDAIMPLIQNVQGIGLAGEEVTRLTNYLRDATGDYEYNQGQTPKRRETATTILALQRASSKRFTTKMRWNEEDGLTKMAEMMISNAAKLGPAQQWIRVAGSNAPQQLELEALNGQWDFIPIISTAEPRDMVRRRFVEVLPILSQLPGLDVAGLVDYVTDLFQIPKEKVFAKKGTVTTGPGDQNQPGMGAPNPQEVPGASGQAQVPTSLQDITQGALQYPRTVVRP
jgi:hypothetical protein